MSKQCFIRYVSCKYEYFYLSGIVNAKTILSIKTQFNKAHQSLSTKPSVLESTAVPKRETLILPSLVPPFQLRELSAESRSKTGNLLGIFQNFLACMLFNWVKYHIVWLNSTVSASAFLRLWEKQMKKWWVYRSFL